MVMIGSLFAGHIESPGETKVEDGVKYKEYFGSASQYQKGEAKNVEVRRFGSINVDIYVIHSKQCVKISNHRFPMRAVEIWKPSVRSIM